MIRVLQIEKGEDGSAQLEVQFDQAGQSDQADQADQADQSKLWIELPKEEHLVWSIILFIAEVGLYHNRRRQNAPKTFLQLLKRLDLSFLHAYADNYYRTNPQNYIYKLESWVLFLFLCSFFDMTQKEFLTFLTNPAHRAWLYLLGWSRVPDAARVSEFKKRFGQEQLASAFCQLRNQIYVHIHADQLSEDDLLAYAHRRTLFTHKSYIGRVGFNLFCHFIGGLGILAELVACLEKGPNATYRPKDLILALLHRVITEANNLTQLANKLQNAQGRGELELAPSRVTLGQAFAKLDAQKVEKLNKRLMKRAIMSKQALRVAIDSSVLEIHGQHEKSAKTVKPHTKKAVRAYKLFAAVDLINKNVLYLKLCEGNIADSNELLSIVKAVQAFAAPRPVEMILFDKGFYKQANFNQLNQGEQEPNKPNSQERRLAQESIGPTNDLDQQSVNQADQLDPADEQIQPFVTPAKKYKTIKEAIEQIAESEYQPYEAVLTDNQQEKRVRERAKTRSRREKKEQEIEQMKGGKAQIAEKLIKLADYKGKIRLVVIKDQRMRKKYRKNGRYYVKDEAGNRLFDEVWETFYHSYLTNIPASQMSGTQIVTAYKGRWRVEDLFEEWKNDWGLKYFPSTDLDSVKAHLHLICILYSSLNLFKQLYLGKPFCRQMLTTLQNRFLQAPHKRYCRKLRKLQTKAYQKDGVKKNLHLLFHFGHWRVQQYHLRPLL